MKTFGQEDDFWAMEGWDDWTDAFRFGYIRRDQIDRVFHHKYSCEDVSPFSIHVLQPIWDFLIRFVPLTVAPNVITLMGLSLVVIAFLLHVVYIPTFEEEAPAFVYIFSGVAIILYHTLDNLDGRQARRTRSGTPIGELLDHSADAFVTCLVYMMIAGMTKMGSNGNTLFFILVLGMIPFFSITWEEYHTRTLFLGYVNGASEGPPLVAGGFFITSVYGPGMWQQVYPFTFGMPIIHFIIYVGLLPAAIFTIASNVQKARKFIGRGMSLSADAALLPLSPSREGDGMDEERGSPAGGGDSALVQKRPRSMCMDESISFFLPVTMIVFLMYMYVVIAPETVCKNLRLVLFGASCSFAYICSRLILAHILDVRYNIFHMTTAPLLLILIGNAHFSFLPGSLLLCLYVLVTFLQMIHFAAATMLTLARHLGVRVLSIDPASPS
eukprot:TRINITY_DN41119_c0_g1_i1.p1 TRINITY_DN41119_c0_g1~~TRINITY_DN41119_c0_g1_i1.p1  ORF type:complete len:440 (-),score=84.92 TRINITY_DN41119_c0_g1_i1:219-1538(-)